MFHSASPPPGELPSPAAPPRGPEEIPYGEHMRGSFNEITVCLVQYAQARKGLPLRIPNVYIAAWVMGHYLNFESRLAKQVLENW